MVDEKRSLGACQLNVFFFHGVIRRLFLMDEFHFKQVIARNLPRCDVQSNGTALVVDGLRLFTFTSMETATAGLLDGSNAFIPNLPLETERPETRQGDTPA